MRRKRSAVEQRREQIAAQVEHLRRRLATRTRKDYTTDFRYERWIKQSHALIDELLEELSALEEPAEYDELPVAVVADELGLTLGRVRRLIKLGDIDATGGRAHERVSRPELERLATLGHDEITRQSGQRVEDVYTQAVEHLRAGDVASAERAYRRLKARQSSIGNYALATEIAIKLSKGLYEEAERVIKFILSEKPYERAAVGRYLSEFIRSACFRDEEISDLVIGLLGPPGGVFEAAQAGEASPDLQLRAMYITAVVAEGMKEYAARFPGMNEGGELYTVIRDGIFNALYAEATASASIKSRMFVLAAKQNVPSFWEPAKLFKELIE